MHKMATTAINHQLMSINLIHFYEIQCWNNKISMKKSKQNEVWSIIFSRQIKHISMFCFFFSAEERVKDRLAQLAREKLLSKEKKLQLERKRRAMAFLNQINGNYFFLSISYETFHSISNEF